MYSSLDSIDIVTQNEATGRKGFLQTDHRSAAEIQQEREVSTLFALTRVLNARQAIESEEGPVDVLYVCSEAPPDFLRSVVTSAGGRVQINDEPVSVYEGPIGTPEDLAEDAFRKLAYRVAHGREASLDEGVLSALQEEYAQQPGVEEDEPGYWTRVVELAAVAGELLRARHGGRWAEAQELATMPFAFRLGGAEGASPAIVNVVGKAERFLTNGERDSLVLLLRMAEDQSLAATEPRPVLFTLKPSDWSVRDRVLCRPLFDAPARADVPLVAYGEDLPNSFSLFRRGGSRDGDLDALHAQALENLKAISVEIQEVGEGPQRVLAVSGHYFAAEKVLDAPFLRAMHERLDSQVLLAAVPRKGLLLVTSALVEPSLTAGFMGLCEEQYASEDSAPISPTPLVIQDGMICGFVQMGDEARTPSPSGEPPRSGPTGGLKN
ncbi:hypothetical protein D187_000023 [Cystobacter fuscus DSM 2262]|uniref:Uncharacterized protein n=1 Tax=Cystobacter fuscus (strain ATCC 25194 / DSM 2262 / NBRC 100088 / M29) TaxID=1242864 RepID=S9PNN8_CYSF2|nr:hypothetical protein [Cystobacter fuscus]EPX64601.1 hypothetical protein D187_000023 [Cystobacter fuscus DSM 2262]